MLLKQIWFRFYKFFSEINFPKYILFDLTRKQFGTNWCLFFTFQTFINTSENCLKRALSFFCKNLEWIECHHSSCEKKTESFRKQCLIDQELADLGRYNAGFHTLLFLKAYILASSFSISLFILRVTEGDCYRERTSVNFLNIAQGSLKEWKHEHSTAGDMRRKKAVNIFVSISILLLEVYCFHFFVCSRCTSDSNQLFSRLLIYLRICPSPSSIWCFDWNVSNRSWKNSLLCDAELLCDSSCFDRNCRTLIKAPHLSDFDQEVRCKI